MYVVFKIGILLMIYLCYLLNPPPPRINQKKTVQNNTKQKNIKQYINIQINIDKYIFRDII